jgi:catechol 2,3-dioxygenase-like lactoylglutathione lyase family enzyme
MPANTSSGPRELGPVTVSPCQLAHLVLRTPNYRAMCDFYMSLLNAKPAFADEMATFIRYDEEHHRVVIVNRPMLPIPSGPVAGLAHFAFTYRSLEELLGTYLRVGAQGIKPCWCINHGFTTSLYYYDPDGNQVETQYDNMTTEDADVFMRSAYFAKNPIGVDFNPELLIERYRRGDPLSELIKQGSAPFAPGVMPVRPRTVSNYDFRGELLGAA